MRFARLVEGLSVSFMRSVMTVFAFLPEKSPNCPGSARLALLVWAALVFALAGTVLML
jgi:peptide/bleomycin uptake transporter